MENYYRMKANRRHSLTVALTLLALVVFSVVMMAFKGVTGGLILLAAIGVLGAILELWFAFRGKGAPALPVQTLHAREMQFMGQGQAVDKDGDPAKDGPPRLTGSRWTVRVANGLLAVGIIFAMFHDHLI